jgi:hypothetical protein
MGKLKIIDDDDDIVDKKEVAGSRFDACWFSLFVVCRTKCCLLFFLARAEITQQSDEDRPSKPKFTATKPSSSKSSKDSKSASKSGGKKGKAKQEPTSFGKSLIEKTIKWGQEKIDVS